ncbi:Glutamine--tRNA ligase [Aspergillus cristatus]|uniref:glutamine--tRNA ligase n=1 Tax=Aspergillus cristatus TaxID=573508 RepID=A0A1E3B5G5_ASPCR|nr:Glutamine--tRNA ligase [Aspergillus cristatus]
MESKAQETTLPLRPAVDVKPPQEQPPAEPQESQESTSKKKEKKEKKAAEKAAKKEQAAKQPKQPKGLAPPKAKKEPAAPTDPEQMFKEGFLHQVYHERPEETVTTRFPPEPNGYLHIGHSKAIAINFGFAKYHGGKCNLRYDDTNPAGEEQEYFESIRDIVQWLGFKPAAITYSSDHFDRLYELAEELIRRDGAYVCHCSKAEIEVQRGGGDGGKGKERFACAHRDRPIEESLKEFRAMRDGKYQPKEASLRMKQDLNNPNPQMWDLAAYRILEDNDHFRTGTKWKIYPTYDFTHCLVDSFENITHSLCTTEFELSRESYNWLINKLDIFKPMQREYGRLNLTGTVLSKRKLNQLVRENHVRGWDDPRLYTLIGLRRRGIPPGAIRAFVNELGVTKNVTNIEINRFEQSIRSYLEFSVPRLMMVLDPIEVIIDDLPDDHLEMIEQPFAPKDPSFGSHQLPFTKRVFIDRSDFREVDSPDYFRMAPGKPVGLLKAPYPVTAKSFEKDESGRVTVVHASYDKPADGSAPKKPKAFIQWVANSPAHNSPVKAEARLLNPLFQSNNPSAHPSGNFLNDINPNSEDIYPNAMIEVGFHDIRQRAPWPAEDRKALEENGIQPGPEGVRFQAMRIAYFAMDRDTTDDKVVLNRIVNLKEGA